MSKSAAIKLSAGLLFAVTLFSASLLLRLDVLEYLGYQVERGRLRALRETLPEASR